MARIIHPEADQAKFNVAGSHWIITRHATNEEVWKRPGGRVPGLVADNDGYLAAFEAMFPTMVMRWGTGPYRLSAVVDGAALGRLANMADWWEAPDPETAAIAKKEIKAGLREPSFVTRTTRKQGEPLPMRTHTGSLQGDSGEVKAVGPDVPQLKGLLGLGNVIGEEEPSTVKVGGDLNTKGYDFPVLAGTPVQPTMKQLPTSPSPGFLSSMTTLANALRGTLVQRQLIWVDRLRKLADTFDAPLEEVLSSTHPALRARFQVGGQILCETIDTRVLYHLASSEPGAKAYLNWFAAYQEAEQQLFTHAELVGAGEEPIGGATKQDPDRVTALLRSMVDDSLTLYLAETGKDSDAYGPGINAITRVDIIRECCEFIALKDADYGQAIRRHGIKGMMARLYDKYSRYTVLASRPDRAGKFESLQDTAKDLLCYSLMTCAYWEEQRDGEKPMLGV